MYPQREYFNDLVYRMKGDSDRQLTASNKGINFIIFFWILCKLETEDERDAA